MLNRALERAGTSPQTVIEVPNELLPAIRELIAKHKEFRGA
jgi:hypothetical protein